MMKFYTTKYYISINGCHYFQVGDSYNRLADEKNITEGECDHFTNLSFKECYNAIQNTHIAGIDTAKTFLFHKPKLKIYYTDCCESADYTKFNAISYKSVTKENKNFTISYLFQEQKAEDVIQYLKERYSSTNAMLLNEVLNNGR